MAYHLHRPDPSGAAAFARATVKRFDPVYWTVDFARPMMAAAVSGMGSDGPTLRVDCVFYRKQDLCGVIWTSEDRWDHPRLAYDTDRDYRRCRLSFRWRSGGVRRLDERHGPTLTIEGRDADGHAKSWYVRLWNYAQGTPEDARITLDFADLKAGFQWPADAQPVFAGDIDRMFISLTPPDYDGGEGTLAAPVEGWAELSAIRSDGSGSVLGCGDVTVPPHGLSVASGYDDCYNLTPARIVRQAEALGYRGAINHYVGMSHYFRLQPLGDNFYVSLTGGAVNRPCAAWHGALAAEAKDAGFEIIWSLSYELFDAHCWNDWKQRYIDGAPAQTGWTPPSALLSPANAGAIGYLQAVARAFVAIGRDAGLRPRFQIGEPWWWVSADGRIALYDASARAALDGASVAIRDMRLPLDARQRAMLDKAGALLAASTRAVMDAAVAEAPGCETLMLIYLPSVLDNAMPEARRVNLPPAWAMGERAGFDLLQVEDYDWAAEGRAGAAREGLATVRARLGYPPERQHYFAGFVLRPDDAARQWRHIDRAASDGRRRGFAATFVWALTQICRDGYTRFPMEDAMDAFDDISFPIAIGKRARAITEFSTAIVEGAGGHEQRIADWADARMRYDAGPGVRSEADVGALVAFYRARRGPARGFRFADPFDDSSAADNGPPTPGDQRIGTGDGTRTRFGLVKRYGTNSGATGDEVQVRAITRPRAGSIRIAVEGREVMRGWVHLGLGVIEFAQPPAKGAAVTAGYAFDVPVRFAEDRLEVSRASFRAGEIVDVPLVEVREDRAD